jgi:toxin-antitoxin system PIN domain toxin
VLLYVVNTDSNHHREALEWWEAQLAGDEPIGLSWMTISGFLRLSTHPRVFAQPLSVSEAIYQVDAWLDSPVVLIVQEAEEHWRILKRFVTSVGTAGNLTSDAHLAALASSLGASVASCDSDFGRFRGIRWENPLDSEK